MARFCARNPLYAFPVFCMVHRLYRDAVRLPPDEARAGGVPGWLYVNHRGSSSPSHVLVARLYPDQVAAGESLLPELEHVQLKLVQNGLVLMGLEAAGYHQTRHQRWWCVPASCSSSRRPA